MNAPANNPPAEELWDEYGPLEPGCLPAVPHGPHPNPLPEGEGTRAVAGLPTEPHCGDRRSPVVGDLAGDAASQRPQADLLQAVKETARQLPPAKPPKKPRKKSVS